MVITATTGAPDVHINCFAGNVCRLGPGVSSSSIENLDFVMLAYTIRDA